MRLSACAAGLWLLAGTAWAAHTAPTPLAASESPPPATARAEADRLLKVAGAEDLFVNITEGDVPTVRHTASGMVCSFQPGGAQIDVRPQPPPRGDDVACASHVMGFLVTTRARRASGEPTLDKAFGDSTLSIWISHGDIRPYAGLGVNVLSKKDGAPPSPPHKTGRYQYAVDGVALFTRISVAVVNGWVVEQKLTTRLDQAVKADIVGELEMAGALDRMIGHPAAPAQVEPAG